MNPVRIHSIPGLSSFQSVHEIMLAMLQERIEDQIEDTILFCEHTPVVTRGRGLQWREGRVERSMPFEAPVQGAEYAEIERGGDLTWHGPGQLVMYPIIKLGGDGAIGRGIGQDVGRYIRFLERVWGAALRPFGLETGTRKDGSGVWLGERKLASVGIAVKRWVTYHGVAMNIVNALDPFHSFFPCGFESRVMTRLCDLPEIPRDWFQKDWRTRWEQRVIEVLLEQGVSVL